MEFDRVRIILIIILIIENMLYIIYVKCLNYLIELIFNIALVTYKYLRYMDFIPPSLSYFCIPIPFWENLNTYEGENPLK